MAFNFNKWLNWNRVTKFSKQSGYITIPPFNFETPFEYDKVTIAGQIHYQVSNNFTIPSLKNLTDLLGHYPQVCIKYIKEDLTVVRYRLFDLVPDLYAPLYNGEVIKKNFTLEFWATYKANTQLTVTIPTSILKNKTTLLDEDTYDLGGEPEAVDSGSSMRTDFGKLFGDPFWTTQSIGNSN